MNVANKVKKIDRAEYEKKETPRRKIINWQIKEGLNCPVTKVGVLKGRKTGQRLDNGCKTGFKDTDSAIPWIRIGSVLAAMAQRVANPTPSLYIIGYQDRVKVQLLLFKGAERTAE